jgi:hypothetical protein
VAGFHDPACFRFPFFVSITPNAANFLFGTRCQEPIVCGRIMLLSVVRLHKNRYTGNTIDTELELVTVELG